MDAVQRWLTLLTLLSGGLAALLYLTRQVWRGFRLVERLSDLVSHELTANGGTSMKDDVAAIAVALGHVQRDVADLTETKDAAHSALQQQLDRLVDELGVTDARPHDGAHKKGTP